jgi:hypothetical protein
MSIHEQPVARIGVGVGFIVFVIVWNSLKSKDKGRNTESMFENAGHIGVFTA